MRCHALHETAIWLLSAGETPSFTLWIEDYRTAVLLANIDLWDLELLALGIHIHTLPVFFILLLQCLLNRVKLN